jgi:DNA-directed RNA polymerase subunit RPC12/RpoP
MADLPYICKECSQQFSVPQGTSFCPFCGIQIRDKKSGAEILLEQNDALRQQLFASNMDNAGCQHVVDKQEQKIIEQEQTIIDLENLADGQESQIEHLCVAVEHLTNAGIVMARKLALALARARRDSMF